MMFPCFPVNQTEKRRVSGAARAMARQQAARRKVGGGARVTCAQHAGATGARRYTGSARPAARKTGGAGERMTKSNFYCLFGCFHDAFAEEPWPALRRRIILLKPFERFFCRERCGIFCSLIRYPNKLAAA
jgi:hypothetical protein